MLEEARHGLLELFTVHREPVQVAQVRDVVEEEVGALVLHHTRQHLRSNSITQNDTTQRDPNGKSDASTNVQIMQHN